MACEHKNVPPDLADHLKTVNVRKPVIQEHHKGAVLAHRRHPCSFQEYENPCVRRRPLDQAADVFIVFNHLRNPVTE